MKFFFFAIVFITAGFCLFSMGSTEAVKNPETAAAVNTDPIEPDRGAGTNKEITMKLCGRVEIYGSEPHTFAGIIDENGTEYAIYPPSREEILKSLQGQLYEFEVILLDKPEAYGSLFLKGGTVTPVKWERIDIIDSSSSP